MTAEELNFETFRMFIQERSLKTRGKQNTELDSSV